MAYTEEEKRFHLQRMWAEGLTCQEAADRYGGPVRATLLSWELAWELGELECERIAAPHACEHERHARYPEETRAEALRLHGLGVPSRNIARALGLRPGTVGAWARAERRAKMPPSGREGRAQGGGGGGLDGRGEGGAGVAEGAEGGAGGAARGAQGADARPKSRRPGEPLAEAEGRVRREIASGERVAPPPCADFLLYLEEHLLLQQEEGAGGPHAGASR